MSKSFISVVLILLVSCNNDTSVKTVTDNSTIKKDTVKVTDTVGPRVTSGKIDIETFGPVKIGQPGTATTQAIGQPTSKSKAEEWGADGLIHQEWNYNRLNLVINMAYPPGKETEAIIFSITANGSNTFKTRANVGIGNTYEEISQAYQRDIDKEQSNKNIITVGSVYGGIIFSFEDGKAYRVFLGPAAE